MALTNGTIHKRENGTMNGMIKRLGERPRRFLVSMAATAFGLIAFGFSPYLAVVSADEDIRRVAPRHIVPPVLGAEDQDFVFMIDFSSSISAVPNNVDLQKNAIIECICGNNRFVKTDGTMAVAVIAFADFVYDVVELQVVDSPTTAAAICAAIEGVTRDNDTSMTLLSSALGRAHAIFAFEAAGADRHLFLSTDKVESQEQQDLSEVLCQSLRTMAEPVQICTALVDEPCAPENEFLKNCANIPNSMTYNEEERSGSYQCVLDIADYEQLCTSCSSYDCNINSIPDECDIECGTQGGPCDLTGCGQGDCNVNGIPDECDIEDCNGDPACSDCNMNDIPDVCDIAGTTSNDCNGDAVPDECEIDLNSVAPGGPFFCTTDCDPDCNDNAVPDECESGACCEAANGCTDVPVECCAVPPFQWLQGVPCAFVTQDCVPTGACCNNGECSVKTEADCTPPNVYQVDGVGCSVNCCPGDTPTGSDCACETRLCVEADGSLTSFFCSSDADCFPDQTCTLQCTPTDVTHLRHPYECHDDWDSPLEPRVDCDPTNGDSDCISIDPLFTCKQSFNGSFSVARQDTITGDLFTAQDGDLCSLNTAVDPIGWYELINLADPTPGDGSDDCYVLTVGLCCTDPPLTPVWPVLSSFGHCPCRRTRDIIAHTPDLDDSGDQLDGFGANSKAHPAGRCEDGNYSATFTVPPGEYAYQIFVDARCAGSVVACESDDDCPGTSCIVQNPDYSVVFTTESCQIAACCVGEDCEKTNELDCVARGGTFLGGTQGVVTCQPTGLCTGGVCCLGGLCNDDPFSDQLAECEGQDGFYMAGKTCDLNPCPACPINSPANCQQVQTIFGAVPLMDRNPENGSSNGTFGSVLADDVIFGGSEVNEICWNAGFLATPCCDTGCAQNVDTTWQIRIYETDPDCDALPGAEVGMSTITVLNKAEGAGQGAATWHYSGSLDTPIALPNGGFSGDKYWYEISAFGETGCEVRATWSRDHGNDHYVAAHIVTENEARVFDHEGIGGVDVGFGEYSGILNPGDVLGSCCTCPAICQENLTRIECGEIGGIWTACANCAETQCGGAVFVSSDPPDGAIDARQPHALNDPSTRFGWDSVTMTFSDTMCSTVLTDFAVEVDPPGMAPVITNVIVDGADVTLNLDQPIPTKAWTTFTHLPSGGRTCLGYLPGDANNDGLTETWDFWGLLDHLNGVYSPPMEEWQCDTDRSGICTATDFERFFDLLNGAAGFDVWNFAALPPDSPCDVVLPVAQLEAGTVTAGGTKVTVNLTNAYVSPVVVCSVQYDNNTTPVVTRVSGVTGTSFDVRLQNPSGSAVATENVDYLVVEEGSWTIDGVAVDAQTYTSTVTDEKYSWVGEAQIYGQAFVDPVIVGQVMSELDPLWSVYWNQGTTRTMPPSASSLRTGKTVGEDPTVPRANETIGFIALETGHGTINGVAFEASIGTKSVYGVDDAPPYVYNFITPFGSAPQVAVVTQAAHIGDNGAWAQTHGASQATTGSLFLSIDEDQLGDAERNHTKEQVFYVVFESPVVYP